MKNGWIDIGVHEIKSQTECWRCGMWVSLRKRKCKCGIKNEDYIAAQTASKITVNGRKKLPPKKIL